MDLGLTKRNALVCGASKGMGKAIAEALAAEGANVFMCARDEKTLEQAAQSLKGASGKIEYLACDLSTSSARETLIKAVKDKFGRLDILVHNTGGPTPSSAEQTSLEAFQSGFDALFQSIVHLNHAFVPDMKAQKWGRIINVTSLSVMEPIAGLTVSNSIRSAATAYLKTLSDELAAHGITVNCIAPGAIATGRIEDLLEKRAKEANVPTSQYQAEYIKAIPAGRLGKPEEFAAMVCFVASEAASYVTGSTICVDGGRRRSTY